MYLGHSSGLINPLYDIGKIQRAKLPDFLVEPLISGLVGSQAEIIIEAGTRKKDDPFASDLLGSMTAFICADSHAMGNLIDQLFGYGITFLHDIPYPVHRPFALCHSKEICRQEARAKPMLVPQALQRKPLEGRGRLYPIGRLNKLEVKQGL